MFTPSRLRLSSFFILAFGLLSLTFYPVVAEEPTASDHHNKYNPIPPGSGIVHTASAQNPHGLTDTIAIEEIATVGGAVSEVEVRGNYAYISEGESFKILDVSNPAHPAVLGEVKTGELSDLQIYQQYAYGIFRDHTDFAEIYILNITNLTSPTFVASFPIPVALDMVINGSYLYVTAGQQLRIYSLSNPVSPVLLGTYTNSQGIYIQDIKVSGSRVYLLFHITGLEVVDVSNPVAPTLLGTYLNSEVVNKFEVSNNLVYLVLTTGLMALDTNDPASMVPLTQLDDNRLRTGTLQKEGNYLYVDGRLTINGNGLLYVVDVSNPNELNIVGEFAAPNLNISDLAFSNGKLYAVDNVGLRILDNSNPLALNQLGNYSAWGIAWGLPVQVGENYIYHFTSTGLQILDIHDPAHPRALPLLTGEFESIWWDIAVAGPYAYFATGYPEYAGLTVLNVNDPSHPSATTAQTDVYFKDPVTVSHGDLFAGIDSGMGADDGIGRFDLTNPTAPTLLAAVAPPADSYLWNFHVAGNYLYAESRNRTTSETSLLIYDISHPGTMALVSTTLVSDWINDFAVAGNNLFLATTYDGVLIFDVSTPSTPQQIGTYTSTTNLTYGRMLIEDNLLYVTGFPGTEILDVSNPAEPELLAYGSYNAYGTVRVGDFLYSTAGTLGTKVEYFVPPARGTVPTSGGSLVSPDDGTTYTFPEGTFAESVTVTHLRRFPGHLPHPPQLRPVERYFEFNAINSAGQPVEPSTAYTITITYDESALGFADESTLALYRWNGEDWTMVEGSNVNASTNTVSAALAETGTFAILGESTLTNRNYMPLAQR